MANSKERKNHLNVGLKSSKKRKPTFYGKEHLTKSITSKTHVLRSFRNKPQKEFWDYFFLAVEWQKPV